MWALSLGAASPSALVSGSLTDADGTAVLSTSDVAFSGSTAAAAVLFLFLRLFEGAFVAFAVADACDAMEVEIAYLSRMPTSDCGV